MASRHIPSTRCTPLPARRVHRHSRPPHSLRSAARLNRGARGFPPAARDRHGSNPGWCGPPFPSEPLPAGTGLPRPVLATSQDPPSGDANELQTIAVPLPTRHRHGAESPHAPAQRRPSALERNDEVERRGAGEAGNRGQVDRAGRALHAEPVHGLEHGKRVLAVDVVLLSAAQAEARDRGRRAPAPVQREAELGPEQAVPRLAHVAARVGRGAGDDGRRPGGSGGEPENRPYATQCTYSVKSLWSQLPGSAGSASPGAPQQIMPSSSGSSPGSNVKSAAIPCRSWSARVAMSQRTPLPPRSPGTTSTSPAYVPRASKAASTEFFTWFCDAASMRISTNCWLGPPATPVPTS